MSEGDSGGPLEGMNDWCKKSGITASFVIFGALNIGMMYVGIRSVDKCPVEQMIPNYLIGKIIIGLTTEYYDLYWVHRTFTVTL